MKVKEYLFEQTSRVLQHLNISSSTQNDIDLIIGEMNRNDFKNSPIARYTHIITKRLVQLHNTSIPPQLTFIYVALVLVILGSLISIHSIPTTALPPTNEHSLFDPSDNDITTECPIITKDNEIMSETLNESHAILMPITAGCFLVFLYYLHTIGKLISLTSVVRYYFLFSGGFAVAAVTSFVLRFSLRYICYWFSFNPLVVIPRYRIALGDDNGEISKIGGGFIANFHYRDALTEKLAFKKTIDELEKKENVPLKRYYTREFSKPSDVLYKRQIGNFYFDWILVTSSIIGLIAAAAYYFFPNNWIISNIISLNIIIWSIGQIQLKNLKIGVLILSALFFYDIYFVFGTEIMATVAQNIELPVKLTLPVGIDPLNDSRFDFALLGAGDIILPGIFISLCLKYDIWKWHLQNVDSEFHLLNFRRYIGKYFIASLIGYVSGLLLCMVSLTVYKVAQPALLYIVPMVLLTVISLAWFNDDLKEFWLFQYDTIKLNENEKDTEVPESISTPSDLNILDMENLDELEDEEDYTEEDAQRDNEGDDDEMLEYEEDKSLEDTSFKY